MIYIIEFDDIYFSLNALSRSERQIMHLLCLTLRIQNEHRDDKELQQLHEEFYKSSPTIYNEYAEEDIVEELNEINSSDLSLVYVSRETPNGPWLLHSLPMLIAALPIAEEKMFDIKFVCSHASRIVM